MTTTQSEDPNERIEHPRHYNQHKSGVETIELIEHLPCNLANATKYVWRCGLKTTETPLRDLKSARWYVNRERQRRFQFELEDEPRLKTDVVWRSLAHRVIESEEDVGGTLSDFLIALLDDDFGDMFDAIDRAIQEEEKTPRVAPQNQNRVASLAALGSAFLTIAERCEKGGSIEGLLNDVAVQLADYRKTVGGTGG